MIWSRIKFRCKFSFWRYVLVIVSFIKIISSRKKTVRCCDFSAIGLILQLRLAVYIIINLHNPSLAGSSRRSERWTCFNWISIEKGSSTFSKQILCCSNANLSLCFSLFHNVPEHQYFSCVYCKRSSVVLYNCTKTHPVSTNSVKNVLGHV